jgi:hypothetical protein
MVRIETRFAVPIVRRWIDGCSNVAVVSNRCKQCGGPCVQTFKSLPYIGPGPLAVELVDIEEWRCGWCGHGDVKVPQVGELNVLIRKLARKQLLRTPRLTFESGEWRERP